MPQGILVFTLLASLRLVRAAGVNRLAAISSVEDYENMCALANYQKPSPSPESGLVNCSDFRNNSCCTSKTTELIFSGHLHSFEFEHCGKMDQTCLDFFNQDYCFVECSPHLGPWLVHSERPLGLERMYNVPLCQSDCDAWYNACSSSMTCAENWQSGGFNWSTGENTCKKGFECKPISEVYKTAKDFCEKVWDHSWKVIPEGVSSWSIEEPPCMHLRGDNIDAHNRNVTKIYAAVIMDRLRSAASSHLATGSLVALFAGSLSWTILF